MAARSRSSAGPANGAMPSSARLTRTTSTRSSSRRGKCVFERLLLLGGEVSADDRAAELGHLWQHALLIGVARHDEEGGPAWRDGTGHLIEPLVVEAVFAQVSGQGAGCRAYGHAG